MDLRTLQRKAKELIDRRGGTTSLKENAEELRDIAKGPGSASGKAKRAAEALKEPGAGGRETADAPTRRRAHRMAATETRDREPRHPPAGARRVAGAQPLAVRSHPEPRERVPRFGDQTIAANDVRYCACTALSRSALSTLTASPSARLPVR